jgi:hypothetical protein
MERVLNQELQPIPLEDGTVLPAAGTPEAGPREVTLSEKDRKLYVARGRVIVLKPANQESAGTPLVPSAPAATENVGRRVGK